MKTRNIKIYSTINRPDKKPFYEKGGGVKLVETSGFIPMQQQILRMIDAGQRLTQARKEMYDYHEDNLLKPKMIDEMKPSRFYAFNKLDAIDCQRYLAQTFKKNSEERQQRLQKQAEEAAKENEAKQRIEKTNQKAKEGTSQNVQTSKTYAQTQGQLNESDANKK